MMKKGPKHIIKWKKIALCKNRILFEVHCTQTYNKGKEIWKEYLLHKLNWDVATHLQIPNVPGIETYLSKRIMPTLSRCHIFCQYNILPMKNSFLQKWFKKLTWGIVPRWFLYFKIDFWIVHPLPVEWMAIIAKWRDKIILIIMLFI